MEGREKILNTEDLYLSPFHPGELSLSSGVISLPSANRLADLSLASDLTDSEVENEATVLTSSACGYQDNSNDIQYEENVKMPYNFLIKSNMLPYSQRSVDSLKKDPDITEVSISERQSEVPSVITKEGSEHEDGASDRKSSKDMNVTEDEGITDMPTVSLDDVRAALQQHCNLVSDRHLLKDLLKSLDDKIEQEPGAGVSVQHQPSGKKQNIATDQKDYVDNGFEEENYKQFVFNPVVMSSLKSQSSKCISNADFIQGSHVVSGTKSFVNPQVDPPDGPGACGPLQKNPHIALCSSSPVEQEVPQKCPSKLATQPGFERHVKFHSTTASTQETLVDIESKECRDGPELQCGAQQSLKIMKKLAGLRWRLMGWEDVSSSPPTESSSSLTFLHHLLSSLEALQLQKKHLKQELAATSKKFKDLSEESYTKQQMYEKRETRLIEADRQLGELQRAWAATQEAGQQEAAKLRTCCRILKQENASLRNEGQCLRNEVIELKSVIQQHNLMKTQMLENEELLAASKKKLAEVLEENNRVNLCLEENKKYLQELEEVKVPQLLGELEDVKTSAERLKDSNKQLSQAKAHLEEDFRMLQEQHKILLKKTVEEQEKKAEAEQKKTILEDEVRGLSEKVAAMKTQLHLHYQSQVADLVARKSTALQEQLKTLESNLQKNLEEELNAHEENHQVVCEKLQKRYEEEIRSIKSSYERQLEKLRGEMRELGQENHRLQQQRQGVISAVSSILGLEHQVSGNPSGFWSLAGPDNSKQAGASSSLDEVKNGFVKIGSCPTNDKNVGNLPHLSLRSSSSSDTESTVFPEGKQTVRHLDGYSQCALPGDGISQNSYHKNQEKDLVAFSDNSMNPKVGVCGECQSQSAMHIKADNSQAQCCMYTGIENCGRSRNSSLKQNLNCKNLRSLGHKESLYPSFTTKIRRASEILQASDLTDEDVCYQDGEDMLFSPQEDEEMARILRELKMMNLSTQGPQSEAPTHDTSLDQDPASLTLHRLSQVSSVLSQYVAHS